MKLQILLLVLLGSLFLTQGCEKNDDEVNEIITTENMILVGTEQDNGLSVEMYVEEELKVGLNKIYFKLDDNVTEAQITHKPMMYMTGMKHSCPYSNPGSTPNEDGLFESEVVFIMASGEMGSWDDTVSVQNMDANSTHTVVFDDLSVSETNMKKNLVSLDADSNQVIYIVTLNGLENPEVGTNEFTITVHKKASMMSFPEVADISLTVEPRMPDMGHGSDGNINPVYTENGKYEGSVVFSMTGYWTIDFDFVMGGEDMGTIQYEVNF